VIDVDALVHATGKPRAIVEATNWIVKAIRDNPDFQYVMTPLVLAENLCWQVLIARGSQDDFDWLLRKGIVTERDRQIWDNVVDAFSFSATDILMDELEDAE